MNYEDEFPFDDEQELCGGCSGPTDGDGSGFCCDDCKQRASRAADQAAADEVIQRGY